MLRPRAYRDATCQSLFNSMQEGRRKSREEQARRKREEEEAAELVEVPEADVPPGEIVRGERVHSDD